MNTDEHLNPRDACSASLIRQGITEERLIPIGIFTAELVRNGRVIWRDVYPNTVVTTGKNHMLDSDLSGAAYTVTGPFLGLISDVGFVSIVAGDTMASHAGWKEAGAVNLPHYSGTRGTAAFNAASAGVKALTAVLPFTFTADGTVKGSFLTYGTGAVNTIDSTAGTLFSAGLFTGGDRAVLIGDLLNCSYQISM